MPRRKPLPPGLVNAPFTIADAAALGVGRGRLASPDLIRPFHGVRAAALHAPAELYAPRLRSGDRFSHATAARLWGAPIPQALESQVHVTNEAGRRRRAKGVTGHETSVAATDLRLGLPVSTPEATFIELGTILQIADLVAVGDYLVLDPRVLDPLGLRPYTSIARLSEAVERAPAAGVKAARRALQLVRPGVESPMETRLRLLLAAAGIPEPVCGFELRAESGRRIGWFDLAWPQWRVIAEYDGDDHRTSARQYDRDISRYDAAADEDWRVVRVRSRGVLVEPHTTVARVERALVRAGWSPIRRKRMTG